MVNLKNELNDKFFNAILRLESIEECYRFFEDVCTVKEITDMSQRLKVAEMLNNENSYQEITSKTGASTATISRVNRCLNYGSGGYKEILKKLSEDEK